MLNGRGLLKINEVIPGKLFINKDQYTEERLFLDKIVRSNLGENNKAIDLDAGTAIVLVIEVLPFSRKERQIGCLNSTHQIKVLYKDIVGYIYSDGFLRNMQPL
jgi:hypothetical protein